MKSLKLKALFLIGILAMSWFVPLTAFAASATLYLSPSASSVSKGSYLTISIREDSGSEGVNSVQANLTYPADLLDFVSIGSSSAFGVVAENSGGGGSVKIARGALPAVSGDQLVATVKFKAKTDKGTATISFAGESSVISASSNSDIKTVARGATYTLKTAPAAAAAPAEAPKDTTPPVISKIEVKEITATTAVVYWITSEPANSEISYGPTDKHGLVAADQNMVTDHKLTLTSALITPGTKYHYLIKSTDGSGNSVSASDSTFTTVGASLQAKVVNKGNKAVRNAKVAFGDISGLTDKNGIVTLTNLPLGKQTGTISFNGKQTPANINLETLLDKNGKPLTATFTIDTSTNAWLVILVALLGLALIASLVYRTRGGGPGRGGSGGFHRLKVRLFKNRAQSTPATTINPQPPVNNVPDQTQTLT